MELVEVDGELVERGVSVAPVAVTSGEVGVALVGDTIVVAVGEVATGPEPDGDETEDALCELDEHPAAPVNSETASTATRARRFPFI